MDLQTSNRCVVVIGLVGLFVNFMLPLVASKMNNGREEDLSHISWSDQVMYVTQTNGQLSKGSLAYYVLSFGITICFIYVMKKLLDTYPLQFQKYVEKPFEKMKGFITSKVKN